MQVQRSPVCPINPTKAEQCLPCNAWQPTRTAAKPTCQPTRRSCSSGRSSSIQSGPTAATLRQLESEGLSRTVPPQRAAAHVQSMGDPSIDKGGCNGTTRESEIDDSVQLTGTQSGCVPGGKELQAGGRRGGGSDFTARPQELHAAPAPTAFQHHNVRSSPSHHSCAK